MAEEVRKMKKLCALFAALLLLSGCAAAVEEPLSLDINAPRFEGTAKGLDWEFIEPPEGEFYYEVCASAGKLYYICNDMLWGTSGGIYVSDMDGGGMRQLLGPEDIVYTDIFDTCSDGEGGLWLLLMGGVPREYLIRHLGPDGDAGQSIDCRETLPEHCGAPEDIRFGSDGLLYLRFTRLDDSHNMVSRVCVIDPESASLIRCIDGLECFAGLFNYGDGGVGLMEELHVDESTTRCRIRRLDGRTGEFDEGLLFDSFVTRIMDAGPEHGLCVELGSYVLDIDPETGEQRQVLRSDEFEGVFDLWNYESIGDGRYLADGKISTPNGNRNICVLITART